MAETLETIKKYIGPFSGAQMDQIFYEILNYTSERYAKGTANGQAVAAGTIGYQDNSYYYSRQALQSAQAAANAADRAEAAVPAGIDSAVLFTRAQTLTSAQQAQARANMAAGGSNPNLLDNPWFTQTCINQRNFTSVTSTDDYTVQHTVDRWYLVRGALTKSANFISFAWNGTNLTYAGFSQKVGPKSVALRGERLTASVLMADGTIHKVSYTAGTTTSTYALGPFTYVSNYGGDAVGYTFALRSYSTTAQQIKAVKLEKGNYSTLANDAPPDQVTERNKCQYYAEMVDNATNNNLSLGYAMCTDTGLIYMPFVNSGLARSHPPR